MSLFPSGALPGTSERGGEEDLNSPSPSESEQEEEYFDSDGMLSFVAGATAGKGATPQHEG